MSVVMPKGWRVRPKFGGFNEKTRAEQREVAARVNDILGRAGIDKRTLKSEWGVTLWTAVFQRGNAVLFVDSKGGDVDLDALKAWLRERLAPLGVKSLMVSDNPIERCCGTGCYGCLNSNPDTNKVWIG